MWKGPGLCVCVCVRGHRAVCVCAQGTELCVCVQGTGSPRTARPCPSELTAVLGVRGWKPLSPRVVGAELALSVRPAAPGLCREENGCGLCAFREEGRSQGIGHLSPVSVCALRMGNCCGVGERGVQGEESD